MNKLVINMNKRKPRVSIIRTLDLIQFELNELNEQQHYQQELRKRLAREERERQLALIRDEEERKLEEARLEELRRNPPKPPRVKVVEEFYLSDTSGPVYIDMSKIPEESLPIKEVSEQVQKAYDRGLADGQISSQATFQTEVEKFNGWVNQIEHVAESLMQEHRRAIAKFEETLIPLAVMIAEQILAKEIKQDTYFILNEVKKAIVSLDNDKIFKIYVNPENIAILEATRSQLLLDAGVGKEVQILPDKFVEPGGCVLETSAGLVDARISTQLLRLKKVLEQEAAKPITSEETEKQLDDMYSLEHNQVEEEMMQSSPSDTDFGDWDEDDVPEEYRMMLEDDDAPKEYTDQDKEEIKKEFGDIDLEQIEYPEGFNPDEFDFEEEIEEDPLDSLDEKHYPLIQQYQEEKPNIDEDKNNEELDNLDEEQNKPNNSDKYDDDLFNDLMDIS